MRLPMIMLATTVVISGCDSGIPTNGTIDSIPFVPTGFKCRLSPSGAYSPGYLYREDENGVEWLTEDFSPTTSPRRYLAALGTYKATINREANIVANLIEPLGPLSGAPAPSLTSDRGSTITFNDGALLLLSDAQEQELLRTAETAITPRPGSRYFVVRDAIETRSVEIHLTSTDEARLGGQVGIANLISLSPTLSLTRGETVTVKGDFENPMNVCMRAVELVSVASDPGPGGSAGGGWVISDSLAPLADNRPIMMAGGEKSGG